MKNTKEPVMMPQGHIHSKETTEKEKKAEEQKKLDTFRSNGQPVMLPAQHIQAKTKVKKEDKPVDCSGKEPVMMPNPIVKKA